MLEPARLHQTGFKVPGLVQDARGIVIGTHAALLLLGIERLVTALRLLSEEAPLDDVLPSLRIEKVRNALGAQAYLVRFSCADSLVLDRWARTARLGGANLCVGAGRHFVPYRDRQAPLGYDARELASAGPAASADYILYTETSAQPFSRVSELPLLQVLSQLELLAAPGGAAAALRALGDQGDFDRAGESAQASTAAASLTEPLWLTVPAGLLWRTARYLWERGARAAVATPDLPAPDSARPTSLGSAGAEEPVLLRIGSARLALIARLLAVPGLQFYQAATPAGGAQLAVELGYTHPLRLQPFVSLFPADHVYLYSGRKRGYTALPLTQLIPLERLVELRPESAGPKVADAEPPRTSRAALEPGARGKRAILQVPLQLLTGWAPSGPRTPTASLVPWSQALWLSRLLYTLPSALLAGLQAACIDEGVLIVDGGGSGGAAGVQALPLGTLLYEPAPGVYVPLGSELRPRLPGELLAAHLGGAGDRCLVLLPGPAAPVALAVQKSLFQPLSQQVLAPLLPAARKATTGSAPPAAEVQHTPISPLATFALWPLWGRLEDDRG